MAAQPFFDQCNPAIRNVRSNQKRKAKKRQLQHSANIVFSKGSSFQTIPSLSTLLEGVNECVVGLQYVWEYRSPSKSVPPHYQCKLCTVSRLQHDMLAHVKGWKHCFRYLKKAYPDKVAYEEEEATKDAAIRKGIKDVGTEVERTEGRGILKVIFKEPSEVLAFKDLRSAIPKMKHLPPQARGPFNPRFSDMTPGEFPPQGGPISDFSLDDSEEPGCGGYSSRLDFLGSGMDQRPFPDGPSVDHFGPSGSSDGFGMGGLQEENLSRMYPDYQSHPINQPMDNTSERQGLREHGPESSSLPNTLLYYLDTFQIENEDDAQLVLKVTQKLTDVLMEYRLRGLSKGPRLSSTDFPSSMPGNNSRYSSSFSGPSKYYE
ncbi:uncharacterized protein [Takifugu rubripes]|uniref:Si:ch211-197h24.6 n=1 Tax=Takifugu rubripes TaxID=31033 RepID=A0A3B5KAA1_TAKRU|nr:uncharacterized protein LOC105416701 [Takifugu rubripes]|eukprot:XP_011603964.1 PREDICTED: uncharacterized protein LOC105416701 [Takifugu rubripes]